MISFFNKLVSKKAKVTTHGKKCVVKQPVKNTVISNKNLHVVKDELVYDFLDKEYTIDNSLNGLDVTYIDYTDAEYSTIS